MCGIPTAAGPDEAGPSDSPLPIPAIVRAGDWSPLVVPASLGGEVLAAHGLDEVLPLLAEAEAWGRRGGVAVGYVAYEAAPAFDPALRVRSAGPDDPPLAQFRLLDSVHGPLRRIPGGAGSTAVWRLDTPPESHARSIRAIRRAIELGDTYQVNFTVRAEASSAGDPEALFAALWAAQPVPHAAYLELGRWAICSASPEKFFTLEGDRVVCRPMKGTARRDLWPARDREIASRLRSSEKERAENLMIVDMVRNDLGRIARSGTVVTRSLFDLERYASVWQLTSTVEARTTASVVEIFRALFPSASITGAPKVRASGIIAELETSPRGVYTGAVGTIGPGRRAELNVAIRTAVVDRETDRARYGVGGGIVWDSTPESEYEECRAKASVLVRAAPRFELFETMLWRRGRGVWLAEEHLRRLVASADHFDLPIPEPSELLRAVEREMEGRPEDVARVRLLWSPDGSHALEVRPLGEEEGGTIRAGWAVTPVDPADVRLYHKTTDREIYRKARHETPDADEAILQNREGFVTELTVGNLVVETAEGALLTPPVDHGLLPGVYREVLLRDGTIREAALRPEDVLAARRVWRVNSVRGWTELIVGELRAE